MSGRLPAPPQPSEPHTPWVQPLRVGGLLLPRLLWVVLLGIVSLPMWPLYALGCAIWGVPPVVVRLVQVRRYLHLIWTVTPPPPGLPWLGRAWLTLSVVQKIVVVPIWGLAWHLDELLYGWLLDRVPVKAPLIEISAARSGSTQLAHYLAEDPDLEAPVLLQMFFPFLWMWRIAVPTLGRFFTPARLEHMLHKVLPPEFLERHEGTLVQTDTFEAGIYSSHLTLLAPLLGPEVFAEEFGFGTTTPHNQVLWTETFVVLLDRTTRKALLWRGPKPDGTWPRLFIKGHFLAAAPALAERYPDARFLTVIREPVARIRSAVNFLRANPFDGVMGHPPWIWMSEGIVHTECVYCDAEHAWFTEEDGPRRHVVRFSDYVADLEGTLAGIYAACLDQPQVPANLPREHPPRRRSHYLFDRSLDEVGVDEDGLRARLADYAAWSAPA